MEKINRKMEKKSKHRRGMEYSVEVRQVKKKVADDGLYSGGRRG